MAQIEVSPEYDLAAIATAAGNSDISQRRYIDGVLYVDGVSQGSLDSALSSYNYADTFTDRLKGELDSYRSNDLENTTVTLSNDAVFSCNVKTRDAVIGKLKELEAANDGNSFNWKAENSWYTMTVALLEEYQTKRKDESQKRFDAQRTVELAHANTPYENIDAAIADYITARDN